MEECPNQEAKDKGLKVELYTLKQKPLTNTIPKDTAEMTHAGKEIEER